MSQTEILNRIVKYAKSFEGLEEIKGNAGWESEEFENAMRNVGWETGQAWCSYFLKMIYYKLYKNYNYGSNILKNFTGSATQTFTNCKNDPRWITDIKNEVPGCGVIWRKWNNGVPDWRGHAGIVIQPGGGDINSHFISIEGNTDKKGTRTGGIVAEKVRRNNHGNKNGLVVEGFIFPPIPLEKLNPINIELPYENN
jgi:hypothetical protein